MECVWIEVMQSSDLLQVRDFFMCTLGVYNLENYSQ